jgi:hypothetical protein
MFFCRVKNYCGKDFDMTNHQPADPLPAGISHDEYIRGLRRQCDMEAAHIAELKEQIKTLRDERDEARREVCVIIAQHSNDPIPDEEYFVCATRGWDCFKEEARGNKTRRT